VHLFGDRGRLEVAKEALKTARDEAPSQVDTQVAGALLALALGQVAEARGELRALGEAGTESALALFVDGLVTQAEGDRIKALELVRSALRLDRELLPAQRFLVEYKASKGDYTDALVDYGNLLRSVKNGHLDSVIGLQRLRIKVNKKEQAAVEALTQLLGDSAQGLSPDQRARIHDGLGLYHAKRREFPAARNAYRAAMEAAPDDPTYSTGLARLDMRAYKLDEAEEMLRKSVKTEPNVPLHRVALARVALLRGDAKRVLAEVKQIPKPEADALLLRARAELMLSDYRSAEDTLSAASRLDSGLLDILVYRWLASFLQGRQPDATLRRLRNAQAGRRTEGQRYEDDTLKFRAYARALHWKRELKNAAAILGQALSVDPRDFRAHYQLCQLRVAQRDGRKALASCQQALKINPHYVPAGVLAAEIAEMRQDPKAVVEVLASLVNGNKAGSESVRRLARAYVEKGAPDKAAALVSDDRVNTDAATERYVRGLVSLKKGDLTAAREALQSVAEELGGDPWAQLAYAETLTKSGLGDQATDFYQRAMTAGTGPQGALGAARSALERKRPREAVKAARTARTQARKSLSPRSLIAETRVLEARAWMLSGSRTDLRTARRLISKALREAGRLPAAILADGMLAELEGRRELAASRYQRLTQVAPKDPQGHYRLGRLLLRERETRRSGRLSLRKAVRLDPDGSWGYRAKRELER